MKIRQQKGVAASLGVFVLLAAAAILFPDWLVRVSIDSDAAVTVSQVISSLSRPLYLFTIAIVSWLFFRNLFAKRIAIATALSGVSSFLLKQFFQVPRPDDAVVSISGYAFPSTHATVSTALVIYLLWLLNQHRVSTGVRILIICAWISVSTSRVILGVHTIADVLAGMALGYFIGRVFIARFHREDRQPEV